MSQTTSSNGSPTEFVRAADISQMNPVSFIYAGKPSTEWLVKWTRHEETAVLADRAMRTITWTDPATGLQVRYEQTAFKNFPAVEWVVYFTNTGTVNSPVLEAVRTLDLSLPVPAGDVVLHRDHGSSAVATDFVPLTEPLATNATVKLAPNGGRSSDGVFPFFNLEWNGGGLIGAIGWSGQWSMELAHPQSGQVTLQAGQQTFQAKLHPGETIRTPRILLLPWEGADRWRGHNLLRRLLVAHYLPRRDGQIVMSTTAQMTFFLYYEPKGNNPGYTEAAQLKHLRAMPALGIETYWLDADWFEGGFPFGTGVGTWKPRADHFPNGLKPLADEAHRLGLQFLLWVEPERVMPHSRIDREHPEWVLHLKDSKPPEWGNLFNLGDPAARAWMTDYISGCISNWDIDIYRTDFNTPPLPFWHAANTADRQGVVENHYIQGLYAMWDELHQRHPRLQFDDCASGGRRIDLEMISRASVLTRSDSVADPRATGAWDQAQTAGLSLYVPLHGTLNTAGMKPWSTRKFDLYDLRSTGTGSHGICQDNFATNFPTALVKKHFAEVKSLRPLYQGDFYPLTEINTQDNVWCAWQFDRPDLKQGFAMFFRRPKATSTSMSAGLPGLDPVATYEVTFPDTGEVRRYTGKELSNLTVKIKTTPGSLLLTYHR